MDRSHLIRGLKPGLTLGIATAVPAFFCLFFGIDEPESAFAALLVGMVLSIAFGLLIKPARAGSAASILWWIVSGVFIGIVSAVAAAAMTDGPENMVGGMILIIGGAYLAIWGGIVGAIIGLVQYFSRFDTRPSIEWQFSLHTMLIVTTMIAVVLGLVVWIVKVL